MASANSAPPAGYPNGRALKAEKEVKSSGNENKNVVENGEDAENGSNVYFMSGNVCGKRGSNGYGRPQQYQHQKYSSGYDSGAFDAAPPGRKPMGMVDSNYSSHSQKMEGEYNSGHGIRPGHMGKGKNVGYQGHNQGVEYGFSDEEEETVMVIKNEEHRGQGNGYGKAWKNQAGGGKHSQGGYGYQKAGGGGRPSEQGGYYEDEFGQACAAAPPPTRNNLAAPPRLCKQGFYNKRN